MFRKSFAEMGISFDIYHRTSSELHHETAQDFFRELHKKGEFIEEESEQYYDAKAEQFLRKFRAQVLRARKSRPGGRSAVSARKKARNQ